ncbi:hypothetical protein PVJ1_00013 [Psychrobacillus phage PVJ1]|nr:hypothetical protein PVJ1_00013 [Psychrobacillus phage PVJ1]
MRKGENMTICKRCNRPLKTQKSIAVGYGPTCKKKHDEAEEEFLKRQITIDEEIAYQEKVRT